jgi:transposase-like protein
MSKLWLCHDKEWQKEVKKQGYCPEFLCRCGRQCVDTDWKRMRFPRRLVEASVDLRHSGLTLASTRKNVSKIHEIFVKADSTICRWSKRFAKQTCQVLKGLGELLHCDETLLKTHKKGKFLYFWAVKCPKTKCIVGYHVSEHRTSQDAKLLMWEARRRFPVGYLPKAIRTDGFPGYRFAIHKVFAYEVKHDKFFSFRSHSNNIIENFFRCKRRFPKFRDIESARKYIGHFVAEYNAEKLQILEKFIIRLCKIIHRGLVCHGNHAIGSLDRNGRLVVRHPVKGRRL